MQDPSPKLPLLPKLLLLGLVLGLVAAACGGRDEVAEDADQDPEPAADEEVAGAPEEGVDEDAQHGGVVVQALAAEPSTLNRGISTDFPGNAVGATIFNGLVWVDTELNAHPSLATDWEVDDSGLTYTFHLREGVTWHDGEPFTSADVRYTYEEVLAELHPRMQDTLTRLESIETPDDHTVVINLSEPFAPFLLQQTVLDAAILPRHLYEGTDPATNPHNEEPVGTGPFVFDSWDRGSSVRVVRNDDYWDDPRPYLDEVIFQIVPEGAGRSTGLETGEIDFVTAFYVPRPDVERLRELDHVEIVEAVGTPAIWTMMMNVESEALSSLEARHAVAHAVDRDRMVEQAMAGLARPGQGAFGDGFDWLFDQSVSYDALYPHDPDRARTLLGEAGIGDGVELTFVYESGRGDLAAAAEIVRENLQEIGISVVLEALEQSVVIERVYRDADFDLTVQSATSNNDPAIGYHRLYATKEPGAVFTNPTGYSNPTVDQLLREAATELDLDRRASIYAELQGILNEDLPSMVLWDWIQVDAIASGLEGIGLSHDTRDRWDAVYWQSGDGGP